MPGNADLSLLDISVALEAYRQGHIAKGIHTRYGSELGETGRLAPAQASPESKRRGGRSKGGEFPRLCFSPSLALSPRQMQFVRSPCSARIGGGKSVSASPEYVPYSAVRVAGTREARQKDQRMPVWASESVKTPAVGS